VETDEERIEHDAAARRAGRDRRIHRLHHVELSARTDAQARGTEATGVDYLRTLALARIVLDNFDNLQASWVTQGGKVGQLSLAYGANDMGSVMIEENVVRAAGASYCMDEVEIVVNIEDAGFVPKRRNMHYDVLGDPVFRERDVPRMLALATARQDGAATEMPDELRNYPARSREGKRVRLSQ
jgi:cyclic dehypoxanthinyl futalosine synthase